MSPFRDIYPYPIFVSALQSLVPNRETYAPMSFILTILFNILYLTLMLEIKGGQDPGIHTIYMGKPAKYGWKITFRVITLGKFQKKMGDHLRRCIFFNSSGDLDILWSGSFSYNVESNCFMFLQEIATRLVSVRSLDYRPSNLLCFCCYCCCYSTAKTTTGCSIHLFRSV